MAGLLAETFTRGRYPQPAKDLGHGGSGKLSCIPDSYRVILLERAEQRDQPVAVMGGVSETLRPAATEGSAGQSWSPTRVLGKSDRGMTTEACDRCAMWSRLRPLWGKHNGECHRPLACLPRALLSKQLRLYVRT